MMSNEMPKYVKIDMSSPIDSTTHKLYKAIPNISIIRTLSQIRLLHLFSFQMPKRVMLGFTTCTTYLHKGYYRQP